VRRHSRKLAWSCRGLRRCDRAEGARDCLRDRQPRERVSNICDERTVERKSAAAVRRRRRSESRGRASQKLKEPVVGSRDLLLTLEWRRVRSARRKRRTAWTAGRLGETRPAPHVQNRARKGMTASDLVALVVGVVGSPLGPASRSGKRTHE